MSIGKYSPTVSTAYHRDQEWWKRNGGEDPSNMRKSYEIYHFDRDGYDSYGYNPDGVDRAGHKEDEYMLTSEWVIDKRQGVGDDLIYTLFDDVLGDWGVSNEGFPAKISR